MQVAAEARRLEVETAVVCLQSFIRARTVRKRLQAAVQAARWAQACCDPCHEIPCTLYLPPHVSTDSHLPRFLLPLFLS
eukprot:scaffold281548_cov17-Tisochrysis_lutea.AAC.1